MAGLGSVANFFAIIVGSLIGMLFKNHFPVRMQKIVMQGLGLAVILIGLEMALKTQNILIVIFSLVIGGIIGELLDIEGKLNKMAIRIESKFKSKNDNFVKGFVQASLVFCVGAMAIMGAIQDGLNNDPSILFNKSILDGFASIAFAASFGIGVLFSAAAVLIYQGSITLFASYIERFLSEAMVVEMTATGGLLILAIGLNIMGISETRVGNLLPAIFISVILLYFVV
ncbi:MAG: DUF554 domain-containing protein [Halanaerobiales bacterium]